MNIAVFVLSLELEEHFVTTGPSYILSFKAVTEIPVVGGCLENFSFIVILLMLGQLLQRIDLEQSIEFNF